MNREKNKRNYFKENIHAFCVHLTNVMRDTVPLFGNRLVVFRESGCCQNVVFLKSVLLPTVV